MAAGKFKQFARMERMEYSDTNSTMKTSYTTFSRYSNNGITNDEFIIGVDKVAAITDVPLEKTKQYMREILRNLVYLKDF